MSRFVLPLKHITRNYAFKSNLKIKWVRPERISCTDPRKSGDLTPMPNIDQNRILPGFDESKELETANEDVRKLFSLAFNPKRYTNQTFKNGLVDKVKRFDFDRTSVEVKVARWTGTIRALQEILQTRKNQKMKVWLKEIIDKRKKHLKYLRRWDYKRFEWLLETLNIEYKPAPLDFKQVTRKDSLRKLTDRYCDGIKNERLEKLRLQLENEQPAFLMEKIRLLNFIRDEQQECGVDVTVSEEEIDVVKKQLEELKLRNETNAEV